MWLITQIGFFSIVDKQDSPDEDLLTIRARCKSDLLALRALYLPEASPIEHNPKNDYAFRIRAARDAVAKVASALVMDIDYPNFKQRISERQGGDRAKYYHHIWHNLYQLQSDPDSAEWLDEDWWQFACGGSMPAEGEEITVLQVGFEGGSINLKASHASGQWEFWLANNEKALLDEDEELSIYYGSMLPKKVVGWFGAISLLDSYSYWRDGFPIDIHPWFAKRVLLLREEI